MKWHKLIIRSVGLQFAIISMGGDVPWGRFCKTQMPTYIFFFVFFFNEYPIHNDGR